jgi:AcrR family transcriptional regulator
MTGKERREQLLDIGRKLFAERGLDGTSIEEIAARAGVSKPVVYEHFGGKEGLYAVVVDREVDRFLIMATTLLEGEDTREKFEAAAILLLKYIEENSDGFRILVRDSPPGSGSGTFASLISDIARQVDYILGDVPKARATTPSTRRCMPRCWSAWWPSPASGGWMRASPSSRRSPLTWSTWPGTGCPALTPSRTSRPRSSSDSRRR